MFARLLVGFAAFALGAGAVLAAEFAGKVKSVDVEKKSIVVTVGEKDVTFDAAGADIVSKKSGKALKNGLASVKTGAEVVVHAEAEGGKASKIEVSFKKKAAN